MRFIIYGPGAIGGTVGGHLALAGCDVALLGRGAHLQAIQQNGLRFVTPRQTHLLRLPAFSQPQQLVFGPADVVLLCTKGQDTEGALYDLRRSTVDVPIFCVQNGVRNEEIAASLFPRVYGAMIRVGGLHLVPGEVTALREPPGLFVIGRYPTGSDELAETVGAALRAAGFSVLVTPEVMPYKWGKLLGNLANAVGAITGEREAADPALPRIYAAMRTEAAGILQQAGIRWVPPEEMTRDHPELETPVRAHAQVARSGSSTWQSLERGQGTVESEFLNGEIVRLAQRLGARAPINAALLRIAGEMAAAREKPGKYAPGQLASLLGI